MKEQKICVICQDKFWTKTTSMIKTCSRQCSIKYKSTPEFKAKRKAYEKLTKELYKLYFTKKLTGDSFKDFKKRIISSAQQNILKRGNN